MTPKHLIFITAFALSAVSLAATAEAPVVTANAAGSVVFPPDMAQALRDFNPAYQAWKVTDYSDRIRLAAPKSSVSPGVLVLDLNRDRMPDAVIDGHDGSDEYLVALLSTPKGYQAVAISERFPKQDPSMLEDWDEGKRQAGLVQYLSPAPASAAPALFYYEIAQRGDRNGGLASSGAIWTFRLDKGKIVGEHQSL